MWHGTQIHDITSGNVPGRYIPCEQKGWGRGCGWFHQKGELSLAWLRKGLVGTEWWPFLASTMQMGLEKTVFQPCRASISDNEGPVISVIIECKSNCGNYMLFLLEGGVSFYTLGHSQGNVFNK